jgi:hypothetical protein
VLQRIYQDPQLTSWIDRNAGTFTFHPEHNHIHFDEYAEFSVRAATPDTNGDGLPEVGPILRGGLKTSFCLIDVAPYDLTLPNASPTPSGFGCGEVQRISVGWMDVYDSLTPGQQIDVSGLPAGQYWLEAVVDPDNFLLEANENNNVGRSLITLGPGVPNGPAGSLGVQLISGQSVADQDFANFQKINISGQVFNDRNGNGSPQSNEHGLSGWVVFIDENGDGVLNNPEGDNIASALATEPWAITDNQGNYRFAGVGPGEKRIRQIVRPGWTQTTANPPGIAARSGQSVAGVLFGNIQSATNTAWVPVQTPSLFSDRMVERLLSDVLELVQS